MVLKLGSVDYWRAISNFSGVIKSALNSSFFKLQINFLSLPQIYRLANVICQNIFEIFAFFFFFRLFPSIRGSHSVLSFSKPSCFQCPFPSHQLFPYLLLLHLKIFSLVYLFSSFLVTPFSSFFFLRTFECDKFSNVKSIKYL